MGVSWLQILSSAKPISYCQIPRSVKIFILTLSFFACNADSVYAKQAVNKQSAVLSVISGSDNTGTVAPIDSRGAKESDKGQVNNGDISLRELIMLIIALVGWLLYAYTRKKIPADEEAKRTAQKNVDKQEEKVQQKNDYDGYKNLLKKVLGYISDFHPLQFKIKLFCCMVKKCLIFQWYGNLNHFRFKLVWNVNKILKLFVQISDGQTSQMKKVAVVYSCIIFESMQSIPGKRHECILRKEGVRHFGLLFLLPSHLHCYSPSLHQNTSPKCLTPSFSISIRDVIQVGQKCNACFQN